MSTVTIPKKEYRELLDKKLRYEYLRQILAKDIFSPPPIRSKKEVITAFRATNRYNRSFLKSLERGLGRSGYFRA